jgi:hypothetical protein
MNEIATKKANLKNIIDNLEPKQVDDALDIFINIRANYI